MSEQSGKRPRRRRGGRGGQGRPRSDTPPPSIDAHDGAAPPPGPPGRPDARGPRQDNRGRQRTERTPGETPPGPPGPPGSGGSRTHRSPSVTDRSRGDRDRPPRPGGGDRPQRGGDRSRDGGSRDRGPRVFETPVPQDERSIELGAAFKETQILMRDARKALAKRKAEFSDEPDWMLEQLAEAERRFEAAASAWAEHLETTGRKVVRGDRR